MVFIITVIIISFIIFVYCIIRFKKAKNNSLLASANINQIDTMSGNQFESYVEAIFCKIGYQAKKTQDSHDFGADVILIGNGKMVIQTKRYGAKNHVGVRAIQEIYAAKAYYEADRSLVITNSHFTKRAIALAEACGVEIVDRENLITLIRRVNPDVSAKEIRQLVQPDARRCPVCGKAMTLKRSRDGKEFFGCSGYPSCHHTESINADDRKGNGHLLKNTGQGASS